METARPRSPTWVVSEVRERSAFVALEPEWNALVAETDDQLFYRHEFIRTWIDNFAANATMRVLTARDDEGRLEATLPLVERKASMYGVPVREISGAANAHSCRFDLIAREPEIAARAFVDWLRADRTWDVLRITDVADGGKAWHVMEAAQRCGMPVGTRESLQSPYVPLPPSHDGLLARLDAKFKANCRRRRRKLEERGCVTLERVTSAADLDRYLEEGYGLEASGWKGRDGSAIAQDKATRGFYTELARNAAHAGRLSLCFLRLDGRAVAFHYALEHGGRYLLLKPGYDEALRECSPGQLLMDEVLKDCINRKLTEFDFLGPDMPWKRDWTDLTRKHTWLFVFQNTAVGRALRAAKFKWVPAARKVVERWSK